MELATRIKQARAKANLTQESAAKAWRVNLGTLRQWEQGTRIPRGLAMEALTDILDTIMADKPASASPAPPDAPAVPKRPRQPKSPPKAKRRQRRA